MTNREFYQAIVEGAIVTPELATFAKGEIEKLDKRNEKRKATPSKTAIENAPIKEKIAEFIKGKDTPIIATTIATEIGITTQKASALARQLVEAGTLAVVDVKVQGKGAVKGYLYAGDVECEVDEGAEEA